jgi:hypothetical protein
LPKDSSGNLSERSKLTKLTEALRHQLAELTPGWLEETSAEAIAHALIREALGGKRVH